MKPPSNCSQQHQGYTGYPKPLMSSGDDHRTKTILAQEADFFLFLPVSGPLLSASLPLFSSPLFAFSAARISALPSSTLLLASALRFEICRARKLKTYGTHDMVFHAVWLNLFKIELFENKLVCRFLKYVDHVTFRHVSSFTSEYVWLFTPRCVKLLHAQCVIFYSFSISWCLSSPQCQPFESPIFRASCITGV